MDRCPDKPAELKEMPMKKRKSAAYYDPERLQASLADLDPVVLADKLSRLEAAQQPEVFRQIGEGRAMRVFQTLDAAHQQNILAGLDQARAGTLLEAMDPDDRAHLLDEMPAEAAEKLLAGLTPRERSLTAKLLEYPEESAGRIMSPEFISLTPEMRIIDALDHIRKRGRDAETVHTLPVTDDRDRLAGMVDLSELVMSAPDLTVGEVMERELRSVRADEDQEVVARLLQAADLLAVPVVDETGILIGLVTVDDAMDVLTREEAEDFARTGGAEPLRRPYFAVSDFRLARSRIVWLTILIVAASLSVQVLNLLEQALDKVVALTLFIPLLIGTGGNTGAQTSTTIVRSMAVGDLQPRDFLRTVLREARVGLLLGGMLATLSYLPVALFAEPQLALVVSLTLVAICTLAAMVGALMPLAAQGLGVDPAVASAPFVTTIVDASGLLIYFLIARAVLDL